LWDWFLFVMNLSFYLIIHVEIFVWRNDLHSF